MKSNIRCKGNTNSTSVIIFLIESQKLPAMVLCLGKPPGRFLLLLFFISFLYLHFIFDLHCNVVVLHCISRLLFHVNGTPPWLLRPAKVSTSSELHPDYFRLPSLLHLLRVLRFWDGVFYAQVLLTQQFFLEVCRAPYWSSKHIPDPSVCLIHSNPQSSYSEKFIFKFYHILSWITCGKKFSLYAPYSFRTLFTCSKSYVKTLWTRLNLYYLQPPQWTSQFI